MRVWVFLSVLTMILAGCASVPETSDETAETPAPAAVPGGASVSVGLSEGQNLTDVDAFLLPPEQVPAGMMRYLDFSTFEPTIAITSDGCMHVTHFRGTGTGTRIVTSCDQGATWEEKGPDNPAGLPCFPNSNDPFVYSDPDTDRIFSSDLHALVSSTLHFSDDGGDTWTCNVLGGGIPPGVHDHQSIAAGPARQVEPVGYPNVVYYCVNRVADSWCATSLNGGLGFGPAVTVFPGVAQRAPTGTNPLENFCGGLTGHVETDHSGRAYLGRAFCGEVHVAVTDDDGLTWTPAVVSRNTGIQQHEVRIAADAQDNIYAFWIGSDGTPFISLSKDHGASWSPAIDVAPEEVTFAGRPAIAAGAEGNIALAYVGIENEEGIETPPEAMVWNAYVAVIHDATNATPTVFTTQSNPDGHPIHVGQDCSSARCGGIGDFIDIEIDPDGRPWGVFSDQCREDACADGTGANAAFVGTVVQGRSLWTGETLPVLVDDTEISLRE